MATQENQLESSAALSLLSNISRQLDDSDIADFTLICGEKEWRLHSAILAIGSPFFKAAILNNMAEKSEMKIVIKELDPEAMQQVINFMYGKPIGEARFSSLLEASERFQMDDMKKDVIRIGLKSLTSETALEIGRLAELYNIEQLLQESAEFIVKNEVEMNEDLNVPKLTRTVLNIYKESVKETKELKKRSAEVLKELNNVKRQKGQIESELEKTKNVLTACQDSLNKIRAELTKSQNRCTGCGLGAQIGGRCFKCF